MKKVLNILLRALIVLIVVFIMLIAVAGGYFFYTRWAKDQDEIVTYSGDKMIITSTKKELEPNITCLFLGVNESLTDFIMLGQYNPNTREVALISIPRDTKVKVKDTDQKINSVYAWYGGKVDKTIEKVEEITGIKADYYVLFRTKVLRDLVDAVGGVTIDVPINMNYDDPYQDLYIHLKKGVQKLNGKQAEQFVRFRKNNNGTGYAKGDVDRIQAQQTFIKAMISRCLEPQNLVKAGDLVNIVLENTKTNVTTDLASQYIDDAVAFKSDRITMDTLPGEGRYIGSVSYFVYDADATKTLIDELFFKKTSPDDKVEENNTVEEVKTPVRTEFSGDKIKIEVLNNGTSWANFNAIVEKLNNLNDKYSVVRVGNIKESENLSKVVSYVSSQQGLEELTKLGEVVGISKLESSSSSNEGVDFTIVLGPKYVAD